MSHSDVFMRVHACLLHWTGYRGCLGQSNQSILSRYGWVATSGKEPACRRRYERHRFDPCREDPLEKETGTHSNILAWKIPWMEDPWTV